MSTFTPSGSAGAVTSIAFEGVATPSVANVAMTLANTEYSYLLPTATKRFIIKLRGGASFRIAYVAAATEWLTVSAGNFYSEDDLVLPGTTLYFQSPAAAQVAEIVYWL